MRQVLASNNREGRIPPPPYQPMIASNRRVHRRYICFSVGAIVVGLLPFVLIECLLRVAGLGLPTGYQDPFIGFSRLYPLFERNAQTGQYHTARYHHYFFGLQQFPATKKPDTFRAFCLGGSTVLGHPYDTDTAFAKWMEIELAGRDPSRRYEIINCGGMSYASYRLIPILEEVLGYDPDLLVVMTGHNEFLEDRTYHAIKQRSPARAWIEDRLLSLRMVTLGRRALGALGSDSGNPENRTIFDQNVDTRLDHSSGYASYRRDEAWWKGVAAHYALNLRVMVQLCQKAGVPILLVNPGSNLRDCPPFKSEHRSALTRQQLATWRNYRAKGAEREAGHPDDALAQYNQAAVIDDQHAELVFRIARCLDRLGRYGEALEAYRRAKELDVCPLRIREGMQRSLFEVAETTSTPVVDAAGLLEKRSRRGIVGFDWYVDQVHPSIRGHQLIAQALVAKLADLGIAPSPGRRWTNHDRRKAYRRHLEKLGDQYLAAGRRRVEWLEKWARRDRLREETVPLDARALLDLGNSFVDFAEYEKSQVSYRMAVLAEPACAPQLMERAVELFQGGRNAAAKRVAQLVLELGSDPVLLDQAHLALAVLDYEDGQAEAALDHVKQVRNEPARPVGEANPWRDELPKGLLE